MKFTRFLALAAFALPVFAYAHPGHEGHELTWDFASGATHPLFGWDHLLAMIAVGLWAAQLGGRNRWLVPTAFVSVMTLGAALGQSGLALPGLEQGIAASLFVLGLLIATTAKFSAPASMIIVSTFALFHGLAHGTEIPANTSALTYGFGFIATTISLHATGFGFGSALKNQATTARLAGSALAIVGATAFIL